MLSGYERTPQIEKRLAWEKKKERKQMIRVFFTDMIIHHAIASWVAN